MPKPTYFNLSTDKRNKIYDTLLEEFEANAVNDVTVKSIVEKLNIPRGSFYQYFESIYDSYFYVLGREIVEMHELFMNLIKQNNGDVAISLNSFGNMIAEEIFDKGKYKLYKNRYLYLDAKLEKAWQNYQRDKMNHSNNLFSVAKREEVYFISAVIHSLIRRLFSESWDKQTFIDSYKLHMKWIKGGIQK